MFFNFSKFKNNSQEKKKRIETKCDEIHEIWNNKDDSLQTDVDGSYTGNPKDFDTPVQDADDL